jgi:hypothetical protein
VESETTLLLVVLNPVEIEVDSKLTLLLVENSCEPTTASVLEALSAAWATLTILRSLLMEPTETTLPTP